MPNKPYHTIRDIAELAGVTPGTVSRALKNNPLVKESTRDRIIKISEDLNYFPNLVARRLSLGKTFAIGIIVPFFTRRSVSERLDGVVSVLSNGHYDLVIHNVENPEQKSAGFREVLRRERIDGALILSMPLTEEDETFIDQADIPVVLVDTKHSNHQSLDCVSVDDVDGGYKATKYLIGLGHTRIAFIGDVTEESFTSDHEETSVEKNKQSTSSQDRYSGYRKALQEAGIETPQGYFSEDHYGYHIARELAKKMLKLPEPPSAVFASNDTQAFGVIQAAREMNLSVPDDLSVMGYDDIQAAEYMELTTIRQKLFESGEIGARILMDKIIGSASELQHVLLSTEMIIRKSTTHPRKHAAN